MGIKIADIPEAEANLSHQDKKTRKQALEYLGSISDRELLREHIIQTSCDIVNLHGHTIYSYNPFGWSPGEFIWRLKKLGATHAGIVEFDVLDGLLESYEAGKLLDMPTVVGTETRTYVPDLEDKVINSPGEAGVSYAMGHAIPRKPLPGSPQGIFLKNLQDIARNRNLEILKRVNDHLEEPGQINYEDDVLTSTPCGNATERHMVEAYEKKVRVYFKEDTKDIIAYWAEKLDVNESDVQKVINDKPGLYKIIRAKLMKAGGPGYIKAEPKSFPLIVDYFSWVESCGGVPVMTWLNGISEGEKDPRELFEFYKSQGAEALNIIPHRNYIHDIQPGWPEGDELFANLQAAIEAAKELRLPISFGTELNAANNPVIDDWFGHALARYRKLALRGAEFFYTHLQKAQKE